VFRLSILVVSICSAALFLTRQFILLAHPIPLPTIEFPVPIPHTIKHGFMGCRGLMTPSVVFAFVPKVLTLSVSMMF
jgi:hypothetical protein